METNLEGPRRVEIGWEDSRMQKMCDKWLSTVHLHLSWQQALTVT